MSSLTASRIATAGYIQVPFQLSFRDIELPEPGEDQILLDVNACTVCGHDMETAEFLATNPRPFGHEISAVVREVGPGVRNVAPGQQVSLESSSFCGVCDTCRNGQVHLCNKAPGFWSQPAMGFASTMLAPACCAVPSDGVDPIHAALAEPCGVALDMVNIAEIGLTDRVLVVGTGPIGLMALAIARRVTTGPVVAINRSRGKLATARELGADETFSTHDVPLADVGKPFGGFDRVLCTAPVDTLPDCLNATAYGGYVVFIGFNFATGGKVTIDTHAMHFGKKQLRSSMASPATCLPQALHMIRTGVVPGDKIISHRFPLSQLGEALRTMKEERETVCKVAVIPDQRF